MARSSWKSRSNLELVSSYVAALQLTMLSKKDRLFDKSVIASSIHWAAFSARPPATKEYQPWQKIRLKSLP